MKSMHNIIFTLILINICLFLGSFGKSLQSVNLLSATQKYPSFEQFKVKFNKIYSGSNQHIIRKKAYEQNLALLQGYGCEACGVTAFFDKTKNQLKRLNGATLTGIKQNKQINPIQTPIKVNAAPQYFDWREKNVITPVRDQGQCGSCWAFATVAYFESNAILKGKQNTDFNQAEQILLKCDSKSSGCNGGNCISASNLVISKGLSDQKNYPYSPSTTYSNICTNSNQYAFNDQKLTYYSGRTKMAQSDIINRLLIKPQMVYVAASNWYMYSPNSKSIFSCKMKQSTKTSALNHAVLLIGYGPGYYLIKNSWGTNYGLQGYIKISSNRSYDCGIGFFLANTS